MPRSFAAYDPKAGRRIANRRMLWFPRDHDNPVMPSEIKWEEDGIEFWCWENSGRAKEEALYMDGLAKGTTEQHSYSTYDRIYSMKQDDLVYYEGKRYIVVDVSSSEIPALSRNPGCQSRQTDFTLERNV